MARRFSPEQLGMTEAALRQAVDTVGVKAASMALRVNEKTLARWLAASKAKDFPVTLIGQPGHAAAQRATIARLLGKRNPATPKARRFVSAKIRKLRREGKPERAAVGEALAIGRRRGFRSIPRRPAKSNPVSERSNLEGIVRRLQKAGSYLGTGGWDTEKDRARASNAEVGINDAVNLALQLLGQVMQGVHTNPRRRTNPVMGLIANESPAVFTVSKRVKEIVYLHAQDGEEYVHPFAPGVSATFLQDGRCVLWRRDGKPVGGRRIGNTIRPIGG